MLEHKDQIGQQIKMLREAYLRDLSQRIDVMEGKCQELSSTKKYEKNLAFLRRAFHSMAGTASSFGYENIGKFAKEGESVLKDIAPAERLSAEAEDTLKRCIEGLNLSLKTAKSLQYEFALDVNYFWAEPGGEKHKTVIMVDDDEHFIANISFQLECFGYKVLKFRKLAEVEKFLPQLEPAAIIMDMVFPEGEAGGADAVKRLQGMKPYHIPVVFLSRRSDIYSRLAAVRAGSDAYFAKPGRAADLIEALDGLTRTEKPESCRILIIDDDKFMADYHAALLEQHGMKTLIVSEPMKVLDYLSLFAPDLILLDLIMPQCSGYELSRLIRQVPAYVHIPIVFLSVEKNPARQIAAMATGGDDFITKPVDIAHFISSVKLRAERMRMLRQHMERDGLSGLYNHSVMKQHIRRLFLDAVRRDNPVALAMLDLDFFKVVNDTYGHAAGDLVILSLARFLEQRLRSTDLIGRMGGEEFAVIMPDTTMADAYQVMEEIRAKFENICHESVKGVFHTTFSCGLAGYPGSNSPNALYNAADAALYKAKSLGRNLTYQAEM
ncbi:MAG: diguanylate cyclase [Pelosinus sp.]|nr:diguanylate cyclase [Pelosinus sp.]